VPGGQFLQLVLAVVSLYVPAKQSVQAAVPGELVLPTAQLPHAEAPAELS